MDAKMDFFLSFISLSLFLFSPLYFSDIFSPPPFNLVFFQEPYTQKNVSQMNTGRDVSWVMDGSLPLSF